MADAIGTQSRFREAIWDDIQGLLTGFRTHDPLLKPRKMMACGKRMNPEIRTNGIECSHLCKGGGLVLPTAGASAMPGLMYQTSN